MPRPPRHRHPLREIREILGKTQAEFAEFVGTSAITIKRIENGTLALSDRLAARIRAATGARQVELLKGSEGKALGSDDKPYTLETFKLWHARWNRADSKQAISEAEHLSKFVELICEAATLTDNASLRSISTALEAAIDEVCRDYALDAAVAKLFEQKAFTRQPLPQGGHSVRVDAGLTQLVDNVYHRLGKTNPGSNLPFRWRDIVR